MNASSYIMTIWQGKILGAFLGFLFTGGHPFGLLIGLWLGHKFDQHKRNFAEIYQRAAHSFHAHKSSSAQQLFFETTFVTMGYVAKADGRVSENAISAARHVMNRMNLSAQQRKQAIDYFNQGKNPHLHLPQILDDLLRACLHQRLLLKMFVETQLQVALADGPLSRRKQKVLHTICQQLGIPPIFTQNHYRYYDADSAHHQYQQKQRNYSNFAESSPFSSLDEAFTILEINHNASHHEIKRAYRKLMSQHHPDKLMAKGQPPHIIKQATEKSQKIRAAYEKIREARGF